MKKNSHKNTSMVFYYTTLMYSTPGVFSPPKSPFKTMPITIDKKDIRLLIGSKGANFITMTQTCGVDYIWYDRKSNKIFVYGWSLPKVDLAIECLIILMNGILMNGNSVPDRVSYKKYS